MLQLEHVSAAYPSGFKLQDICFETTEGRITGIIGPNGSGKSTLLKAICRDVPAQGSVKVQGKDLWRMSVAERARTVAIVPQNIEKLPVPVLEFVMMGRTPFKKWHQLSYSEADRALALEKLRQVGLAGDAKDESALKRTLDQLSGGERHLAAIARALCQEPQLLLLDEPTANLDLAHQVSVLQVVAKVVSETSTDALLVIHDINLASAFCHNLLCLSCGKMAAAGKTDSVLAKDLLEKVYGTGLCIGQHPLNGRPLVLPEI